MQNNFLLKIGLCCIAWNPVLRKLMYLYESSELPFVRLQDLTECDFTNERITILFFAEDINHFGGWKAVFVCWNEESFFRRVREISCLTLNGLKFAVMLHIAEWPQVLQILVCSGISGRHVLVQSNKMKGRNSSVHNKSFLQLTNYLYKVLILHSSL